MIRYRLRQINEKWTAYNSKVIRMQTTYEVTFVVPKWLDLYEIYQNPEFLELKSYKDAREYTYEFTISSTSKCDQNVDEFDEKRGVHICETRAEIKALEKVKKIINSIYSTIGSECFDLDLAAKLDKRILKNINNLDRLKD